MSVQKSSGELNRYSLLAWVAVFPFLAAWPFLSALPAFSLLNQKSFDLPTSLDIVFLATGFWPVIAILFGAWWLTNGKVRLLHRTDRGLVLGAYATVWNALYIIAAMASR